MRVNVYRLRENGTRLPPEAVKARPPVAGRLDLHERARHDKSKRILLASLLDDKSNYLLRPLDHAWVKRISEKGILIAGLEIIPMSRGMKNAEYVYTSQTWWCVYLDGSAGAVGPAPRDVMEILNLRRTDQEPEYA